MTNLAQIGGDIRIGLTGTGGRIAAVSIRSTRPEGAARIFEGKPAETMCGTIGRVFSLCGRAQTVAALAAVEQAQGIAPDPGVARARDALRRAEMLTQVVTRLALHWPRVLGLPLAPGAVRAAMAAELAIEQGVLGAGWRRPGAGLDGGRADVGAAEIDLDALVAPLSDGLAARGWQGYGALPAGAAPECGVLATYWDAPAVARARAAHGAGLAARLAAAETALRTLPGEIAADLAAVRPAPVRLPTRDANDGVATVETARGPLTHRVRVEGGQVVRCRTEAPTEANFTETGPVASGLLGAVADPVAAELHVLAIDPCVAARVELASG
ncbi:MAG: hypothetical protein KDK11_07860 [Maritimibacter sp.]|nr:hypothetical protein [Maritimibacter sp.]